MELIERQAALDIFDDYNVSVEMGELEAYSRDRKRLCELPAVQPVATDTNVGDTISRQAAIDALDKRFDNIPMEQTAEILMLRKDLRELPTIQPEPHEGHWIRVAGMNECCSACNKYFPLSYFTGRPFDINYCPNCGAKMKR